MGETRKSILDDLLLGFSSDNSHNLGHSLFLDPSNKSVNLHQTPGHPVAVRYRGPVPIPL